MAATENYIFNMPFMEQINYFRGKVNLPTKAWTDMWQGMHSRAFVVAGAAKADLLCDLRAAVDKAISQGTTLKEFRKDFGQIVQKCGWDYKGGHDWRTRVIYETNLNAAAAAGRYKQMTDPDVLKLRPYWRYRHGGSAQPREEHLRFDGLVLSADDPFWLTHYPPNGWGCSCYVESLSDDDLAREGITVQKAPEIHYCQWQNPKTGETMQAPEGIDPGWAYNVGDTAWGRVVPSDNFKKSVWQPMTQGQSSPAPGAPAPLQSDIRPDYNIPDTPKGITEYLTQSFGGRGVKIFEFNKNGYRLDLAVDAKYMAAHIAAAKRAPYLPYLQDLIQNPQEVWLAFEQNNATGKVRLRQRFLKFIEIPGSKSKIFIMAFDATNGKMSGITFIPIGGNANSVRNGYLVYKNTNAPL